jgi:hypothetical protein
MFLQKEQTFIRFFDNKLALKVNIINKNYRDTTKCGAIFLIILNKNIER